LGSLEDFCFVVCFVFSCLLHIIRTHVRELMSRHPHQPYLHHHHPGWSYITVHDHDVLSGRGVNIAQHPGNERFRALVRTRFDESYCTNFSTSEKRALAQEIIKHITSLDPPGRFLKRAGKSQSSRGLSGPWEELPEKDCIKKTVQALRDCNRPDRQDYASDVVPPEDVIENAERRSKSGLTLKEHAENAVAKANPLTLHPHHVNLNPPPLNSHASSLAEARLSLKRSLDDRSDSPSYERLSPSAEHAAEFLKRQRSDDHLQIPPDSSPFRQTRAAEASPVTVVPSTPATRIPPVPVTNTPVSQPYVQLAAPHTDPIPVPQHTTSPQVPSPVLYHSGSQQVSTPNACTAPYSPVAFREHIGTEIGHPSPQDLHGTHYSDHQTYANNPESQHFNKFLHHHDAASAAEEVAFMSNSGQDNTFALHCEEPDESFGIDPA